MGVTYHVAFVVQFAQEVVNRCRGGKFGPPDSSPARRFSLPAILFVGVYPDALTKKANRKQKNSSYCSLTLGTIAAAVVM